MQQGKLSCGDCNLEKKWISEYLSVRTLRTSLMPHWKAILDFFSFWQWWKSPRASKQLFMFLCTSCTHDCAWVCVRAWSSTCKCDSFTRPQSSISFQPQRSLGRAFPVCCVAPCASVSPRCVRSSREALTAFIMTWHAKRVGWRWQWGGEMVGRGGVFSLQQALFSPRSPGHHTPAGTHLIMHPVWRGGQTGNQKSTLWWVVYFREVTSEFIVQQVIRKDRMCALNIHVVLLWK